MPFKAIHHFLHNFFRSPGDPGYWSIAGTTYWTYRMQLEGWLFFILTAFHLWLSQHPTIVAEGNATDMWIAAGCFFVGAVELLRLWRLRRAQAIFEEVFYG